MGSLDFFVLKTKCPTSRPANSSGVGHLSQKPSVRPAGVGGVLWPGWCTCTAADGCWGARTRTTGAGFDTPPYRGFAAGPFLSRPLMAWFWDHDAPDRAARAEA